MIVNQMKFENEKKIKLKRIENYNDNNENNKMLFFYLHLEETPTKSFRDYYIYLMLEFKIYAF